MSVEIRVWSDIKPCQLGSSIFSIG